MMMKRIFFLTTFLLLSIFMIGQNTAISYDNIRTDNIRSYRTNLTKMWNDVLCNKNLTVTDTIKLGADTLYQYTLGSGFSIERGNSSGNSFSGLYLSKNLGNNAKAWMGTSFSSIQISDDPADTDISIDGNTGITGDLSVTGDILSDALQNTKIGTNTGNALTTGQLNSLFGYNAGYSLTTGSQNVFIGNNTGEFTTTADYNVALGANALNQNTTGYENVALGENSLPVNTVGYQNIAVGASSMQTNVSGNKNTALGNYSLIFNSTGSSNVSIGDSSMWTNDVGNYNVAIGNSAGYKSLGSNNIFIGSHAGYNETGSNKLYIANSNTATPLIKGSFPNDSLIFTAAHSSFSDNLKVTDTLFANTFTPYSGTTQTFTGNVTLGDAAGDKLYIKGDSIYVWNDTITGDIEPEYMSGNIANETVTIDTVYSKCFSNGSWTECLYTVALDSAETWNFPITSKTVQFDIFVNGGNEHVIGTVTTAGVVLIGLGYGTVTWDDADTGGDYCIIDGGDYGILKNRVSGAKKTFFVKLKYNL